MLSELERFTHTKPAPSLSEKLNWVNQQRKVQAYLSQHAPLEKYIATLSQENEFALKALIAAGQGPHLFDSFKTKPIPPHQMDALLQILLSLEDTYETIGGIIGYHCLIMRLMTRHQTQEISNHPRSYQKPPGIDLSQDTPEVKQAICWGIESLSQLAELYPVGGAGDRLDLHSELTGEALPAACLLFCGRTLLEGLIRDLQAREYLYYKLHHKQLNTPLVMMTSLEKNNQAHIQRICKEKNWFGRSPDQFRFLIQPMVPMVAETGEWVTTAPLELLLKPGGHGLIWKLAEDEGVFEWLSSSGHTHTLVRQVNNPIAGTDDGLTAFIGWGHKNKKLFGFSSCPRLLNTAQGMDVLVTEESSEGVQYSIRNIEYTEFTHQGIENRAEHPGSPYSLFPANTNILFANIYALQSAVQKNPLPGLIVNMKNSLHIENGAEVSAGRLESTMQSIADLFTDLFPEKLAQITPHTLRTYLTYNKREKTISAIKNSYVPGGSLLETPEGCFYDLLNNHRELLTQYCGFEVDEVGTPQEYLEKGPGILFLFHPALGPFYRVIAAKLKKGKCSWGAELQLDLAEVEISNLKLTGSLLISATDPCGHKDASGHTIYSDHAGKCVLKDVTVSNQGIDYSSKNFFWKNQIQRHASLQIVLHGNAEFFAEGVTFLGDLFLEVPAGERLTVRMSQGKLEYQRTAIQTPSWHWKYTFLPDASIQLTQ